MHRNNPKNKYILVFNDIDNLKKGSIQQVWKEVDKSNHTNTK